MNSSSSATNSEGTQTDVECNRPTKDEADNRQKDDANEDYGDITLQDQPAQATDEQEKQEGEEDQSAVTVAMKEDVNIVENPIEGEPSYRVRRER